MIIPNIIYVVFYKECWYWRGILISKNLDLCRRKVEAFNSVKVKTIIIEGYAGTIPHRIPWWKIWIYKKVT